MVVLPATLLGALVGLVSGYRGGIVDDVLMRFTEMFQVLPRFFLALVAVAILGPGLEKMALVLIITSWPVLARVVRGEVMALRSSDFVVAAYATGASPARVLLRQVLPNVVQPSLVVIGLLIGQLLLVEGSLGFLGLGDPDAISWGSMVGKAHGYLRVAWWVPVFPGAAIAVAVLGFNLLAEGVGGMLRRDGAQGAPSSRT
jgi:peptide/nickel transport system permease protein